MRRSQSAQIFCPGCKGCLLLTWLEGGGGIGAATWRNPDTFTGAGDETTPWCSFSEFVPM